MSKVAVLIFTTCESLFVRLFPVLSKCSQETIQSIRPLQSELISKRLKRSLEHLRSLNLWKRRPESDKLWPKWSSLHSPLAKFGRMVDGGWWHWVPEVPSWNNGSRYWCSWTASMIEALSLLYLKLSKRPMENLHWRVSKALHNVKFTFFTNESVTGASVFCAAASVYQTWSTGSNELGPSNLSQVPVTNRKHWILNSLKLLWKLLSNMTEITS